MTEHEAKLSHRVQRCEFLNELRHKQTRQGRFDAAMYHLDHPLPGTDFYLAPSDHGAGAEAIYSQAGRPPRDRRVPLWQILYLRERKALKPRHRAVLDALCVDLRPRVAARLAHVGKNLVYECLGTVFPQRFTAAYRALSATQVNR